MQYTRLGTTGLQVSRICLGCMSYGDPTWRPWVLEASDSRPFFERALALGINFFDTADMYSLGRSEEITGRVLNELVPRDQVVIASKVYFPMGDGANDGGLSRKHILDAIDASLQRLGTDYIDLYQIHRWDEATPIDETLEALHDVVRAGKVRYIGASSMFAWQMATALYRADLHGWTRFVSMQNHYNLIYREEEREMLPLCRAEGIGVLPWSPLARGWLTRPRPTDGTVQSARARSDSYAGMYGEQDYDVVDAVVSVAQEIGASPAQTALAWLLRQPSVTAPIIGATKMAHLEEAVGALDVRLDDAACAQLEAPYRPHGVLGH